MLLARLRGGLLVAVAVVCGCALPMERDSPNGGRCLVAAVTFVRVQVMVVVMWRWSNYAWVMRQGGEGSHAGVQLWYGLLYYTFVPAAKGGRRRPRDGWGALMLICISRAYSLCALQRSLCTNSAC